MGFRLIVGLGNPGASYERTRHNVGYRVLEGLEASRQDLPATVRLYKPEGVYMNESGRPVAEMARRNGILPEEILMVYDDFAIPIGTLRLRTKGSAGGHNGVESIIQALGTDAIPRVRVGIGPVPEGRDPADFVLQRFTAQEKKPLDEALTKAIDAVRTVVTEGFETAMNRFNGKGGDPA
jgi:PTH1 family peptidyl-tRNA hydrolase